jgi:outer membrane protein assembly factor BamB
MFFTVSILNAADWTSFRGNQQMNSAIKTAFPEKLPVLWSYDAADAVESTATIIKDTVYIGCKDGTLLALSLNNGKLKWKWKTEASISSTPLYLNNRLYFGDESGIFHAVNLQGKEIWKFSTDDKIISSANTDGRNIIFGSYDNYLYCLGQDGKKIWSFKTEAQVHCSPCIAENKAIIAGCDGKVRIIDIKTGKEKSSVGIEGNISASPAYYKGHVYVGTLNGDLLAINIQTGKIAWKKRDKENGSIYSSAAVNEKYVIFSDRNGKIFVLSRINGKTIYEYKMKKGIDSSPVIIGNSFYLGSDEGLIIGLKLIKSRKPFWSYNTGDMIKSSCAVSGTKMIIGCNDGAIYCFGK